MEFIPSTLCETGLFVEKAGSEIVGQMYTFSDKGGRDLCLIPEVTAVAQREFAAAWSKSMPRPVRIYYLTRCYRYERPQLGRYREFWQFGVECLDDRTAVVDRGAVEVRDLLRQCLGACGLKGYRFNESIKRGLDYYVEDGFEVEMDGLGAQKQIAGGGRYHNGVGWAVGVERLMAACEIRENNDQRI